MVQSRVTFSLLTAAILRFPFFPKVPDQCPSIIMNLNPIYGVKFFTMFYC